MINYIYDDCWFSIEHCGLRYLALSYEKNVNVTAKLYISNGMAHRKSFKIKVLT